jgi:hypothetical protein
MNRVEQEKLAARLAKILGLEDPGEPGFRHRDLDTSISIRCSVTEDGVWLNLDLPAPVAEKVLELLAGIRWQDT